MKANVGISDRSLRIFIGIILVLIAFLKPGTNYDWFGWVGLIPLVTGLIGWCPIYEAAHLNTREKTK